jgi:hypothetical protein
MGTPNPNQPKASSIQQTELPLFTPPEVMIPAIRIPQPDGSLLIKPGKPVVLEEHISTVEAAKILGMSQRWVLTECETGAFKTAFKPGKKPTSRWKISRSEVMSRLESNPDL